MAQKIEIMSCHVHDGLGYNILGHDIFRCNILDLKTFQSYFRIELFT